VQLGVMDMAECYVTGKKTVFGNKRSHALNATRRMWKCNLQTVRIKDENGNVVKVKVSARALKKNNLERV
jgi:large subunit ribosomal protein L28